MTRRRAAIAAALLLAAAAATWALWPDTAPSAAPTSATTSEHTPRTHPPRDTSDLRELGPWGEETSDDGGDEDEVVVPTRMMSVTVTSAVTHQPLAGAEVTLLAGGREGMVFTHHGPRVYARAVSGADGVAELRVTLETGGELRVEASVDFYQPKFEPFVDGMTLALDPLPALNGRVENARHQPVAGARISSSRSKLTTFSDGSGRFTLRPPTHEWVFAEKDRSWGRAEWGDDKTKEVVVVLEEKKLAHRVVDRKGSPLSGVSVDFELGAIAEHLQTNGEGVWNMSALETYAAVTFTLSGYAAAEVNITLSVEGDDVVLTRSSRIEGMLVTPEGTPVPGARLAAFNAEDERGETLKETVTGPDGRFTLDDLGALRVELTATLGERDATADVELAEGATATVRMVLRPQAFEVKLEVVDSRGVEVMEWDYDAQAFPIPEQGWTQRSVVGRLALSKGKFRIEVKASQGEAKGTVVVDVDPGPDTPPIRVTLDGPVESDLGRDDIATHSIKVHVRTASGVAAAGAAVECMGGSAVTGPDGVCECKFNAGEDAWPIPIVVSKDDERGMTRVTADDKEVEVVLKTVRTINGHLDGQLPPGQCQLELNSSSESGAFPLVGKTFSLPGRAAARAYLCVRCKSDSPDAAMVVAGCAVVDGQDEVVISVGAVGTLTLKLLDSTGKAVEFPVLYLDRNAFNAPAPGGELRFDVPPGTHVLVVNILGKRERAELPVTIRSGETTALGTVQLK